MPRQDGIGSRAPTHVVALCGWWWTCHVDVAHTRDLQAHLLVIASKLLMELKWLMLNKHKR